MAYSIHRSSMLHRKPNQRQTALHCLRPQNRLTTMIALHPNYVTDTAGTRVAVQLPVEEYERLLDEAEMAEDIAAYGRAKAEGGTPIPWEQVKADLAKLP
jgi:hypothetical protein